MQRQKSGLKMWNEPLLFKRRDRQTACHHPLSLSPCRPLLYLTSLPLPDFILRSPSNLWCRLREYIRWFRLNAKHTLHILPVSPTSPFSPRQTNNSSNFFLIANTRHAGLKTEFGINKLSQWHVGSTESHELKIFLSLSLEQSCKSDPTAKHVQDALGVTPLLFDGGVRFPWQLGREGRRYSVDEFSQG